MTAVTMKRGSFVPILIGVLCVAYAFSANPSGPERDSIDKQSKEGREQPPDLQKKYEEIVRRLDETQQQVSWLSRTSPPVGAVVAFAGEWPPKKRDNGKWTEEELGWAL